MKIGEYGLQKFRVIKVYLTDMTIASNYQFTLTVNKAQRVIAMTKSQVSGPLLNMLNGQHGMMSKEWISRLLDTNSLS